VEFQLSSVSFCHEVYELAFFSQSSIQTVYLLQKSFFNKIAQPSDIADSIFSFVDDWWTTFNRMLFILDMISWYLVSQWVYQILQSWYLRILLFFYVLKFAADCLFNRLLHWDSWLQLAYLSLQLLLNLSVLLPDRVELSQMLLFQWVSFRLTLVAALVSFFLLFASDFVDISFFTLDISLQISNSQIGLFVFDPQPVQFSSGSLQFFLILQKLWDSVLILSE